ncbi:phage tail tip fiber protein [Pseudomonas fulva]|uniref:phage tail protein n=1 Tax=Pseudomonas fulva TaxID=47880 RepID=UPI003CF271B5
MSGGVKKLAQVVVGAVIGFVQGGPVGAVIGAGLAFYAAEQQEKLNTKSPLRDNEPSAQTVRSSKAPVRYILGRVSTGGVLVWAQEERGAQTTGEWLHLVYVLCEGAIDELEYIYLGEELIGSYGADASYELVVNPTQVNTFLKENCPDWKDTQIGRGLSYVRISLRYSAEKFPSGIPDARFVVRGRNDIYDPRTGRLGWTENTALHLLWFLQTRCGVPDDEIVFETFASGANVCNESVQNPDGSSSPRYRSGCVIGADEQRTNVLQKLEAACAGKLIRVGGRWMFQAGAYYGPYDFEITEDMVIGTITGNTEATNDAAINTIRGTFIDPLQSWTETDYPEVSVAQWVEEDGGEAAETLSFSYVSDPYQAQRLANIELRRRRSGGALNIPLNLAGYNCRPGRAVRVNLPSLNILGEFMVTNWSMGTSEGCTASVQAYEAAIFDDAVGKPYNPIGFIKLPAGGLGSPTNLRWDVEDAAEISQGVLSWDRPAGIVSGFAVTVRQAGAAVQALQVPETTTRMPISGLTSGSYTMGVSALGPLARSGEATITVDVNGPPMPETCAVQATIDTITLIPGNALHGLNGGTYEYFWSPDPAATQGEFLGRGLSITHTGLSFAKSYAYFVRSKNAYGVSAFLKVVAATSMDVGAILEGIKGKITGSELGKELTSRIDLIDKNGPGSVNERVGAAKTELAKQISDVNNALGTVKGNLEQQITAVSADVSAAKTDLQQQIANVSALAGSLPYRKDKAYSVGQSALGSDGKLYQALKAVPLNTPPPNTTYWTDVGQAVVTANGMAARVSKVETDVSTLVGKVTAQASQISGLQAGLSTTNDNVTKKADASAVSSLGLRVSDAEGKLSSQATRMDGMQTSIDGKASSQALQQVTSRVTATEDKDKAQDQLISSQSQALTSLTDSVSKKAEAYTVTQLANDVKAQGNTLSAQGSSLTKIEASLPSISGENLLANSSFEEVIADGTRPRHWAISGAAARAFVSSPLTSSLNALRISATVGAGSYIEVVSSPADGRTRVKVTAGVTYTLSVYARGSGAPGFLRMYLQFLDAAGAVLSAPATSDKPVLGENFTRYTLTGTAPANAAQVNVYACRLFNDSSAAANIWAEIDNVQLQEGGLATAYHPSILAAADASAEAVTSLGARVDKNEQGLKSTGEQVTRLTSSLVITDGNVDKAQKAAQDAYGLADGKGKVIVQSAAPGTTDRLPQNLWIDTTGNANTPKRWTGSAWLAVTDKVATDAAAAAQNALNQLGGKADASALANLGSTVEQQGKDITAAGQSITRIDASIASSGAENLLFNPSFDVASASNSGLADGWGWRKTATVVVTPSLRDADLGAEGKCQRLDISGFTAGSGSTYLDFVPSAVNPDVRPPVYEGIINTASVFVRGNTGLTAQIYLQYKDGAGTTLSTDGPANIALTPTYQRLSLTSNPAPANAVKMDVLFRIRSSPGSSLTGGFVDLDKAQLELGQVATGWRDNGKAASTIAAANAAATTALAGRVSKTEEGLTSASSQLTQLDNSLGDAGGENLFYNPGFTKAASSNGSPEGWETEGPVTTTDTLVTSWMNAGEKAQRIIAPGLTNSTQYKSLRPSATKRIKVSSGQAVTASIYARKNDSDVGMRIFIQWVNTAGAVISAPNSALIPLTIAGSRVTFSAVAPSGSAEAYVYFRIYAMTPTATNGTVEFARPQAEYGNRATGWRDNGQVNSDAVGAVSVAVDGLTSSVSQQGKDITSVSGRTTTLENSVNSTTDGLSTKASSSALNSVAGRVSSTESGLTAQATSISNLEAKLGAAQAFVAGQTWEFTGSTQGWGANTSGATLTAGPLFVTVAKYTTIQATNTFPKINGAENPLLRIRLRRRSTGRSVASMYWANEDGGLAEARRINWPINIATTEWQDIEIDLSGHAGWNGKNIWAIRLDMYNSGDANGEVDIAYIAAGRRSVAASGRAFDSLSVNVSQQGDKLAAETQRINGLQSSVGDANAAIQSEASTRASADAAMSKRVDGVQSSLGSTNAAVQQISNAQANLDGKVNATWSVKLGLTSGGSYYAAGFGLGLENQGGTFQSSFVVLANRFSVLNPIGEGLVNIFTAENGQVVMNDALISKLTVQRAIVGSSINSSELANDGTPIMRMDFASGTLILLNKAATAYTVYNRRGIDMVINGVRRIRMGEWD